jgi:hypothetical protein
LTRVLVAERGVDVGRRRLAPANRWLAAMERDMLLAVEPRGRVEHQREMGTLRRPLRARKRAAQRSCVIPRCGRGLDQPLG